MLSFPMQSRGSRRWENSFVCLGLKLYALRIEAMHSHFDRNAVLVELWDYHIVFYSVFYIIWKCFTGP
jgi:hypothetical protein